MTPGTRVKLRQAAVALVMVGSMVAMVGCDPRPFFYFLQPFEPTIAASRAVASRKEGGGADPRHIRQPGRVPHA